MKIVKYFFFASLLALGACGDDDNNKENGTRRCPRESLQDKG